MFITNMSNFFHFAAVFIYQNCFAIIGIMLALVVINFVRKRAVAARKRSVMKRRVVAQKPATAKKTTFDPFAKIEF